MKISLTSQNDKKLLKKIYILSSTGYFVQAQENFAQPGNRCIIRHSNSAGISYSLDTTNLLTIFETKLP